jgi:hypothetical protein
MSRQHTKQYEKLLQAVKDPSKKNEFHDDPDIGHIVKKLSVKDFETLNAIAVGQSKEACCPPGVGNRDA